MGDPVEWHARAPRRAFLVIFLAHVALQGLFLSKVPTRYVQPHTRWEITAVAMSLYERGEFADPYCLPTGPTAHMPPVIPALLATLYALLGPTLLAGYVSSGLFIAGSGVMYGMLPWLAARLGLPRNAGLIGGMAGALVPRYPEMVEPLAAIAIGLMVVAFLGRWTEGRSGAGSSLGLGATIGLSLHLTPALLPVALGLLVFELAWMRPRRLRGVALLLLSIAVACVPWTWRNYRALGGLFFMRSNFGLELRMGNHEGAGATLELSARGGTERHPRSREDEARKVQRLGELEYMRQAGHEAATWIHEHPWAFLRLTGLRVAQFWLGPIDDRPLALWISTVSLLSGLGLWRTFGRLSTPQRAALLIPFAAYPLVYYLVGFEARYRRPLDGLALLLAGAFISATLTGTPGRGDSARAGDKTPPTPA
jgi:hypothetical protein